MAELLTDNKKVLRQLRGLIDAGTGSPDADIAAYAIAGWLDAGSLGELAKVMGALFIEDGFDAAVKRMAAYVDAHNETGSLYGLVGLLAAAAGEGET